MHQPHHHGCLLADLDVPLLDTHNKQVAVVRETRREMVEPCHVPVGMTVSCWWVGGWVQEGRCLWVKKSSRAEEGGQQAGGAVKEVLFVDTSVYTRNRSFRLLGG